MVLRFLGEFKALCEALEVLGGQWTDSGSGEKSFRLNEAVMCWSESSGEITFKGRGAEKWRMKRRVLELIDSGKKSPASPKKIESERPSEAPLPHVGYSESNEEVVFGIVSRVGLKYQAVADILTERLKSKFQYDVIGVRVSECLPKPHSDDVGEYERIRHFMQHGDNLRQESKNNAILATGVVEKISSGRDLSSRKARRAFIISTLKHPDEVDFLKKTYGDAFYLIGIHSTKEACKKYLTRDGKMTDEEAEELIAIDEEEYLPYGQKTRDTFHLADFFLDYSSDAGLTEHSLERFLDLIFAHPYKNPTFDEFAMFLAFNSAVRSSDLSRQVGAVISQGREVIATGANDVPSPGGGTYWAELDLNSGEVIDHPGGKDHTIGLDYNKKVQHKIIAEISKSLKEEGLVSEEDSDKLVSVLTGSAISDLTEFSRVVHAEMDALLSCARSGISSVGATLYCTTFPCHNCAKHIVASGIKSVIYVEPYPKSRASELFKKIIAAGVADRDIKNYGAGVIPFKPFIGVGPRRFLDLFAMSLGGGARLRRKDEKGETISWSASEAKLRTPMHGESCSERENAAIELWKSRPQL